MRKTLAILLAAVFMVMACAVPVYADEDESDEAEENEAGEGDSGDGEQENSMPGFELPFAAGAALAIAAAARLIKTRKS